MDINPLIFVVDDDRFSHAMLRSILKKISLTNIEDFYSGEECINHIRKKPDYILLDFEMEGINGLETLKFIKSHSPNTRVIMISGQEQINVAVKAMKSGVDEYFVKDSELLTNVHQYFSEKIQSHANLI